MPSYVIFFLSYLLTSDPQLPSRLSAKFQASRYARRREEAPISLGAGGILADNSVKYRGSEQYEIQHICPLGTVKDASPFDDDCPAHTSRQLPFAKALISW